MAYAKTSLRKQKRDLREKMRAMGLGYRDIAAEFARRYNLRPRAAWREAYGWSLSETAGQINDFRGHVGMDPGGFAGMTAPHLCEHENWPGHGIQPSGRRPTPYLLAVLAAVYDCAVTDLIDLADREHLPPADLLILDRYSSRSSPGEQPPARAASRPPASTWPGSAARTDSGAPDADPAFWGIPADDSLAENAVPGPRLQPSRHDFLGAAAALSLLDVLAGYAGRPAPAPGTRVDGEMATGMGSIVLGYRQVYR